MTENDVNQPINNGPMEKRNEFIDEGLDGVYWLENTGIF